MNDSLALHTCEYTEEVFRLLGKRWTGLIVDLLLQRPARFGELGDALPDLSNRVLTERLAELQDCGIVCKETTGAGAAMHYRLTTHGEGLAPAMSALRVWAGADETAPHSDPRELSAATSD